MPGIGLESFKSKVFCKIIVSTHCGYCQCELWCRNGATLKYNSSTTKDF